MPKKTGEFPRWSAPFVGMFFGAIVGLRVGRREGGISFPVIAGGAALGAIGGCLVFLLDTGSPKTKTKTRDDYDDYEHYDEDAPVRKLRKVGDPGDHGTVIGRFLALTSVLLFWAPIVNVFLTGIAFFLNRKVVGWPKTASKISLVVSSLVTVVVIFAVNQ